MCHICVENLYLTQRTKDVAAGGDPVWAPVGGPLLFASNSARQDIGFELRRIPACLGPKGVGLPAPETGKRPNDLI